MALEVLHPFGLSLRTALDRRIAVQCEPPAIGPVTTQQPLFLKVVAVDRLFRLRWSAKDEDSVRFGDLVCPGLRCRFARRRCTFAHTTRLLRSQDPAAA